MISGFTIFVDMSKFDQHTLIHITKHMPEENYITKALFFKLLNSLKFSIAIHLFQNSSPYISKEI